MCLPEDNDCCYDGCETPARRNDMRERERERERESEREREVFGKERQTDLQRKDKDRINKKMKDERQGR